MNVEREEEFKMRRVLSKRITPENEDDGDEYARPRAIYSVVWFFMPW